VTEQWAKYKVDPLVGFLERYSKFLADNKSGWLVGDQITWADIIVAEFLSVLQDCFDPQALKDHSDLKKYVETVQNVPQLKKYIEGRPKTAF